MKKKLLSRLTLVALVLLTFSAVNGQYYSLAKLYNPGNPGGLNTDPDYDLVNGTIPAGASAIISYGSAKRYTLQYSASQTIPFAFNFNGGPVTKFKASSSGYVTFSKIAATPTGSSNVSLPTATLPDSSICVWGFAGAGLGGQVYTKVYGSAPNRQLWITYWFAGNPTDTNSQNIWAIVLEETTNRIYVVDMWGLDNTTSPSGIYNPINLTVGVQVNSTTAFQISGSPNIQSLTANPANTDNDFYEFDPGTQPTYDASVIGANINSTHYYEKGKPYTVVGLVANFGTTTLTSFNLNYSVNGGPAQVDNVTGASIASTPSVQYDVVSHSVMWTPPAAGLYNFKLWANNLNSGNTDMDHSNDTLVINNVQVIDSVVQKMVLLEEFNQASCDPCALATPNLDSVLFNNQNVCIPVRYHVSWPGQDFMNQVTDGPFVSTRVSFYNVGGVPDGRLDGSMDVSPASLRSAQIQQEAAEGSPFWIHITSCNFNSGTDTYSLTADIHCYTTMPAGLKAQTVLTVDTIKYKNNQSTETIAQYDFPQVAEDMLPGPYGTTLNSFTSGQVQTINVSWTKDHPWGASPKSWLYDSVGFHMEVFIQDTVSQYVYQAAIAPNPNALGVAGINADANNITLYPNPANGTVYVGYNLKSEENVSIELYNLLGEKIYSVNKGTGAQGKHLEVLNLANAAPGLYFVHLNCGTNSITKKLVIQ